MSRTISILVVQASADAHARSVSSCIVLLPGQPAASSGGQGSLSEAPGQTLCATVRLGDLQRVIIRVEPEEGGTGLARTLRLTAVVVADVSAVTGACLNALHIGGIGRGLSAGLCLLARRGGAFARTRSAAIQHPMHDVSSNAVGLPTSMFTAGVRGVPCFDPRPDPCRRYHRHHA